MTCSFTLSHEGKTHELTAVRSSVSDSVEVWRVSGRDPNLFISLSNDRPLLHQKHLYSARFKWEVLEGEAIYRRMVVQITTYLEYYIKGLWKPPKKGKAEKKLPDTPQGSLF